MIKASGVDKLDLALAYIHQHLQYAVANGETFSDAALGEIFRHSAGTARIINKAYTHCPIHGSQHNKKIIDDHIVRLVIVTSFICINSHKLKCYHPKR